jgi:hypothetical protein
MGGQTLTTQCQTPGKTVSAWTGIPYGCQTLA